MRHYLFTVLLLISCTAFAQNDFSDKGYHASLGAAAIGTSNNTVPFWMRSNQYGSIPLDGLSTSAFGTIGRNYKEDTVVLNGGFDWGFGVSGRLNAGNSVRGQLIEAYAKIKYSVFELKAGRSRDAMGLVDTSLSSGAFAVSGNALGIPKLEISIPDFWTIPVWDGLFAVKGNFAFGYMGKVNLDSQIAKAEEAHSFYHQKSLYLKIGKASWPVKLSGGFNHQVNFGEEKKVQGEFFDLNNLETMLYVVIGKAYKNGVIPISKIGNHIGSIDQSISYESKTVQYQAYHQFYYDVGGLYHLNNLKDGLWGVSLLNLTNPTSNVRWKKFLIEFINSKSQGGEVDAKITPSGDENYYNNYIYKEGWSYKGENLGNNFFTNKKYQKDDLPAYSREYFGNNRLMLVHLGIVWEWKSWQMVNKISFSRNFGTYATSPVGNSLGGSRTIQPPPYFSPVNQFSAYLEASRPIKNNFHIGFVLAGDYGDLLSNSIGGQIKLSKSF